MLSCESIGEEVDLGDISILSGRTMQEIQIESSMGANNRGGPGNWAKQALAKSVGCDDFVETKATEYTQQGHAGKYTRKSGAAPVG